MAARRGSHPAVLAPPVVDTPGQTHAMRRPSIPLVPMSSAASPGGALPSPRDGTVRADALVKRQEWLLKHCFGHWYSPTVGEFFIFVADPTQVEESEHGARLVFWRSCIDGSEQSWVLPQNRNEHTPPDVADAPLFQFVEAQVGKPSACSYVDWWLVNSVPQEGRQWELWLLPDSLPDQMNVVMRDDAGETRRGPAYRLVDEDCDPAAEEHRVGPRASELRVRGKAAVDDPQLHANFASGAQALHRYFRNPLPELPTGYLRSLLGTWDQKVFSRAVQKRSEYKQRPYTDFLLRLKGTILSREMLPALFFLMLWGIGVAVLYGETDFRPVKGAHTKVGIFLGFVLVIFNTQGYERHQHAVNSLAGLHTAVRQLLVTISGLDICTAAGGGSRAVQREVLRYIPALLVVVRHTLCNGRLLATPQAREFTAYIIDEVGRWLTVAELRWLLGKGFVPGPPLQVVPEYWRRCRHHRNGWLSWDPYNHLWTGPLALCPLKDRTPDIGENFEYDRAQVELPPRGSPRRPGVSPRLGRSAGGGSEGAFSPHPSAAGSPQQVGRRPDPEGCPWQSISMRTRGAFWVSAPRQPTAFAKASASVEGDDDVEDDAGTNPGTRPDEDEADPFIAGEEEEAAKRRPGDANANINAPPSEICKTPVRIVFLLQRAAVAAGGGCLNHEVDNIQHATQVLQMIAITRFPFAWAHAVPIMVWLYLLTLPFELVQYYHGSQWVSVVVLVFLGGLYLGFMRVARDLSTPFGFAVTSVDVMASERELHRLIFNMFPELTVRSLRSSQGRHFAQEEGAGWDKHAKDDADRWRTADDKEKDKNEQAAVYHPTDFWNDCWVREGADHDVAVGEDDEEEPDEAEPQAESLQGAVAQVLTSD
eukprot:TRINITY_DN3910_c0_g1_i1.p1 TRINITY_DN3910_c0_g1~~TRINITY_DN3910_c0_g1_i1.p1  ORF type:complete len:905 (+),score=208.17 TRINITY_DN3910_c0_g1_i1:91-2715(+)